MPASLTEAAIEQVRELIASGSLSPGERLPPEAELAESLGTGRNTIREAVRALVSARVLEIRRGDGTFVTSLRPELLLAGIGAAADLLLDDFTLELVQVRRILEPAATRFAATRITDEELAELDALLHRMSTAASHEEKIEHDEAFHQRRGGRLRQCDAGVDAQRGVQPNHPRARVAGRDRSGGHRSHDLRAHGDSRRVARPRSAIGRGGCPAARVNDRALVRQSGQRTRTADRLVGVANQVTGRPNGRKSDRRPPRTGNGPQAAQNGESTSPSTGG